MHKGFRYLEAFVVALLIVISVCFGVQVIAAQPAVGELFGGFVPSPEIVRHPEMLYIAIGIIGATVMPHNLYLHSALVQTRAFQSDERSIRKAIQLNTVDSIIALSIAFLVNASILVLAAITFYGTSTVTLPDGQVITFGQDWIQEAYHTLTPLLGAGAASVLFAVALLASGQSSTVTGTLAGQVVMEGFMRWKIRPWLRRMITRLLAIVPAILVIGIKGDQSVNSLLTLSQVILGIQLPLAMIPLLHLTSSRKRMGKLANGWFLLVAGWSSCILITALDLYGLGGMVVEAVKG
jgi:manganese transport protein